MIVPSVDNLPYSFWPGPHYLIDDAGNVVGCFPAIKEVPLSQQKYTQIHNINWYK